MSAIVCFPDSDRQSCAAETRLWQRYVGWFNDLPTESPPVCSQRCSSAAQLNAGLHLSDHATDTLASFHWLRAPERIDFKLAVLVYRALQDTAPRYLSDLLCRVADLPSRRRLRSATSSQLDVRPSRLVTVGDPSFASAGPKLWNSLPDDITSASSLSVFRKKLKTLISAIISGRYFQVCYGFFVAIVVLEVNCYLGHVTK